MATAALFMLQAAQQQHTFPVFVASALLLGLFQVVAWKQDGLSTSFVLGLAVVLRLVAFPTPPVLSDDVYRYVWDGWVVLEGMNPYAFKPSDAVFTDWHGNALYDLLNSADFHSVYPPVTQLFFAAGALLGREIPIFASIPGPTATWWPAWMGIKSLFLVAELVGLWVLSRHVRARTLQLVALSPVLLIAGALQGHTDILLLPLLAAGVASWSRGRWGMAITWVTLAGWVKLVPLVLLPFLILGALPHWKGRFRLAGVAVLASVLVWIPFAASYVPTHVASSLNLYVVWFEFNAGPYYLVKEWYELRTGADWSKQIGPAFRQIYMMILVAFGAVALIAPRRLRFVLDEAAGSHDQNGDAGGTSGWWAWKVGYSAWALYLVFSTTVHPWYLIGVLVLGAVLFENRIPWHWWALSVMSVGTYLFYSHGPEPYWWAVRLGWGLWFLIWVVVRSPHWLQHVLAWRADAKYAKLRRWIGPGESVLDVGGGEGYLALRLIQEGGDRGDRAQEQMLDRKVAVAEVRSTVKLPVEEVQYDGFVLPLEDNAYDVVVMTYVLHHAEHPERVFEEALRVARRRVVVLESTYRTEREQNLLRRLDMLANRLRSAGRQPDGRSGRSMKHQEAHLQHRPDAAWIQFATGLGGNVVACRPIWRPLHRQFLFVTIPGNK